MKNTKLVWILYLLTIFTGAFLLFLIQPLMGKIITPQYGGTSQVWCLSLLYFQLVLLAGYGLTYYLCKLSPKIQGIIYICLLVVSIFLLGIPLGDGWVPKDVNHPIISLLTQLIIYLTPPVLILCTISTLMQKWFNFITDENPYYLYSISNIGSLLALLLYPMLIEPNFSVDLTLNIWKASYIILFVLALIAAIVFITSTASKVIHNDETVISFKSISIKNLLLWILLSACGTSLLISSTNNLTHDISPVPLIWVVPLAVYLSTFILCFGDKQIYDRFRFLGITFIVLTINAILAWLKFIGIEITILLIIMNLAILFCFCMICNGEIYETKPAPDKLPTFYLSLAFGGALGGIFVNIIAPQIFCEYSEYLLTIYIMFLFSGYLVVKNIETRLFNKKIYMIFLVLTALGLAYFIFNNNDKLTVIKARNFYGIVKVGFTDKKDKLIMLHGTTNHGFQLYDSKSKKLINKPTAYFGEYSAIGIANYLIRQKIKDRPLKIGIIGLGVGTMAYYGQRDDEITFYEIDPKIKKIAENHFNFLKDSKAKINIIIGDGRLSLKRQEPQKYDIIALDAFNSDAVPVHLLTKEALKLYLKHLNKDGLILFNISNRFLDLNKVLNNIALDLGLKAITIDSIPDKSLDHVSRSKYIVLSRSDWFNNTIKSAHFKPSKIILVYSYPEWSKNIGIWTDNYSNIFSVFYFITSK